MTAVRVVSYNIFAPVYADRPDHYFKCQPKYLKTDYRWNLIQRQLEEEIVNHENTIICLQEVSFLVLPKLELFFHRLKYTFFHNLYGQMRDDYLSGIGIAIPMLMQLNSISMIKIGDYIRSMSTPRVKKTTSFTWIWDLYQCVTSKYTPLISDPWETAMALPQTLICLEIVMNHKSLYIGTYHMPCSYKEPDVMVIHSSIVKDFMFALANGKDFILAGDFNIKPRDITYQALIEKDYAGCNLPESTTHEIAYRRNAKQVLKSAYREKNGVEPIYTDFSHKIHQLPFCETLDYIFFSGRSLVVETVLELSDHPTSESYPDETHPSDHLIIAATFKFE